MDYPPMIWSGVSQNQFTYLWLTILSFEYVKNWSQNGIKLMIVFFVIFIFFVPGSDGYLYGGLYYCPHGPDGPHGNCQD